MNRLYVENEKVMNEAKEIDLTKLCAVNDGAREKDLNEN